MANRRYTGNAPLVAKVITVAAPLTGGATKLGPVGGPYAEHTSWDAATLVAAWNAMEHPFFREITASQSSTSVVLTHKTPGEDFHVEALIPGVSGANLPLATATTPGRGPDFFMDLDNWENRVAPNSEDKIIIDDTNAKIRFEIDCVQTWDAYDTSGGFRRYRLTSKKRQFVDLQKVRIQSDGTLPSALSAGYAYVHSPDEKGCFFLSPDGNPANRYTDATAGSGTHKIGLYDMKIQVYARYPGKRIGLPFTRQGVKEYLPRALNCWFKQMVIGDNLLGGSGLAFGRFDAEDSQVSDGVTLVVSESSQDSYPAVCFNFNNAALVFNQMGGDGGLSPHDGEVSVIDHVNHTGGDIVIANTTCDNPSTLIDRRYRIFRSTIPGVTNQFIA